MNSGFKLVIGRKAVKFLNKQGPATKKRLTDAIEKLLLVPPKGDVKKMQGGDAGLFRLRVGTYRMIFEKDLGRKSDLYSRNRKSGRCLQK
jgi:mRNA interferase RelE/StbE